METKAKVVTKMYSMIEAAQSELIASGQMVDRYNVMSKGRRIGTDTVKGKSQFSKDVVIYLVFAPTCSICHRMAKVLAPIKDQVVALQVPTQIPLKSAAEGLVNLEGLNPSTWADADTMQRYVRGKVPVILVYSKKSDQVAKLEGAQPLEEIMKVAAYVSNQKG
jgi:thioredoxin-related protein